MTNPTQLTTHDTMTRIEDVYCRPTTEDEWRKVMPTAIGKVSFGAVWFAHGSLHNINQKQLEYGGRTEITVQHFLDLLHDRIAPWRLEEVGFINRVFDHTLVLQHVWNEVLVQRVITVCGSQNNIVVRFDGELVNITTFTDLLTLIKFLTPPTK